ncbi:hypothetical protein B0182_02365 [Moraxella bovis]|nr:hypothetical protein B0182_02365 [Moraxella bovis]
MPTHYYFIIIPILIFFGVDMYLRFFKKDIYHNIAKRKLINGILLIPLFPFIIYGIMVHKQNFDKTLWIGISACAILCCFGVIHSSLNRLKNDE